MFHPLSHLLLVNLTISDTSHPESECAPQAWEMAVTARSPTMKTKVSTQALVGVMLEAAQGQGSGGADAQQAVNVTVQVAEML
jgi:hypothetical protein